LRRPKHFGEGEVSVFRSSLGLGSCLESSGTVSWVPVSWRLLAVHGGRRFISLSIGFNGYRLPGGGASAVDKIGGDVFGTGAENRLFDHDEARGLVHYAVLRVFENYLLKVSAHGLVLDGRRQG